MLGVREGLEFKSVQDRKDDHLYHEDYTIGIKSGSWPMSKTVSTKKSGPLSYMMLISITDALIYPFKKNGDKMFKKQKTSSMPI